MANIVTYPLNKIEYQATDAELFHATRTSGIYANTDFNCSVTGADNTVTVGTGIAWIKNSQFSGKVAANKSAVTVDLGIADASLPRWDVVCLQFDKNKNATDIVVKKGTTLNSPVMPAIVQTETLYELYLCKVYRPAGAVAISANDVYDLRLDPELCGLMADSVTSVDTSAINAQINALIEQLKEEIEKATSVDKGINTYTASGTVNDFTLTGTGENGKFKANFTGLISSVAINGEEYTVLAGNETEIELSINSWYTFVLDSVAKTINFKSGGGLSSSKLAETTAVLSDVLINKTFFSKTKELKTGAMADKSGTTQSATASLDTTNSRVQMTVPATGKYSTTSKLYTAFSTLATLIGIDTSKMLNTLTVLGKKGTIVNKGAITTAKSAVMSGGNMYVRMEQGAYLTNATSGYPEQSIPQATVASAIGLTAAKIVKGNTILGVAGTAMGKALKVTSVVGTGQTATYTSTLAGNILAIFSYADEEKGRSENVTCTISGSGTVTKLSGNGTVGGYSAGYSKVYNGIFLVTGIAVGSILTFNSNSTENNVPINIVDIIQLIAG